MPKKEEKIVRIDIPEFDERFYQKEVDGVNVYRPSVNYKISTAGPSNFGLLQWRGDVGNRRAEEILEETSFLGSWVHDALERMLLGNKVTSDEIFASFKNSKDRLKVKRCLKAFTEWYIEMKPKVLATEFITWNDEHNFAGTIDLLCEIAGEVYIVDFKTSKAISDHHKWQVCAYGYSEKAQKVALLHLGNTTKKKWSFNVLDDEERAKYFREFVAISNSFEILNPDAKPNQETFPEVFVL